MKTIKKFWITAEVTSGKRTEQRAATSQRLLPVSEVEGGRRLLLATSTQSPAALVRPGTTFSAVTGAVCPVGAALERNLPKEALPAHISGERQPEAWVQSQVSPSRSGLQGICSPSLARASVIWASSVRGKGRPSVNWAFKWLWIKHGDTSQGLVNTGWITWSRVSDAEICETPDETPGVHRHRHNFLNSTTKTKKKTSYCQTVDKWIISINLNAWLYYYIIYVHYYLS